MKLPDKTVTDGVIHGRWYEDACAAAFAMELLGERWSLLIVRELMLGPRRFSEMRGELPGLSAKVLTERLVRLENIGVLVRRRLPPPISAQVFELTDWGRELEEVIQALGRWAVRSPLHDATLPMTPTSFLLSLRTMLIADRGDDFEARVLFRTPDNLLFASLAGGELNVAREPHPVPQADLEYTADSVVQFLGVFYGKRSADECGVTVTGDPALAALFADLFSLPPKCPVLPAWAV
ncbi:MAG: helix-turn-helix transcriptional regulator [Alphaproteobacteria bacterium]|nr:helix-turn-helix transcriptional regulator [Alphaproteobacteria bacterium]